MTRLRFAQIKRVRHFRKVSDEGREKDNLDLRIHPNGVRFYRNNLLKIRSLLAGRKIPLIIVKQPLPVRLGWAVNDEVEGVHCIPAHRRVSSPLEHFHDYVHPSARGRRAIADAVFSEVAK